MVGIMSGLRNRLDDRVCAGRLLCYTDRDQQLVPAFRRRAPGQLIRANSGSAQRFGAGLDQELARVRQLEPQVVV
jgi:hypothetical protein